MSDGNIFGFRHQGRAQTGKLKKKKELPPSHLKRAVTLTELYTGQRVSCFDIRHSSVLDESFSSSYSSSLNLPCLWALLAVLLASPNKKGKYSENNNRKNRQKGKKTGDERDERAFRADRTRDAMQFILQIRTGDALLFVHTRV